MLDIDSIPAPVFDRACDLANRMLDDMAENGYAILPTNDDDASRYAVDMFMSTVLADEAWDDDDDIADYLLSGEEHDAFSCIDDDSTDLRSRCAHEDPWA